MGLRALGLLLGLGCTLTKQSDNHPTLHIQQPLDGEVPAHARRSLLSRTSPAQWQVVVSSADAPTTIRIQLSNLLPVAAVHVVVLFNGDRAVSDSLRRSESDMSWLDPGVRPCLTNNRTLSC